MAMFVFTMSDKGIETQYVFGDSRQFNVTLVMSKYDSQHLINRMQKHMLQSIFSQISRLLLPGILDILIRRILIINSFDR